MNRRSFLRGTAVLAPAVILTPGLLMQVRPLAYVAHGGVLVHPEVDAWLTEVERITATEIEARRAEAMGLFAQAFWVSLPPERHWFTLRMAQS